MQTTFTPEQLTNHRIAEADNILRRCIHCGLCTAVCPTYVLRGDERDSPRGRIYLIKGMLEEGGAPSRAVETHVDRCLSCLSCMTACPSGVDYMHLVDIARTEIERGGQRSYKDRLVRRILAEILPYPNRFRVACKLAALAKPLAKSLRRMGFREFASMIDLAPKRLPDSGRFDGPGVASTTIERRGRVILAAGCAQQVLRPDINDATIRLLARNGVDVAVAAGAVCCGALTHHLGKEEQTIHFAKMNVDAWSKELSRSSIDAIIVNASGCGTMVKDYGHLLAHEPEYAARAKTVSELAKDVSEFIAEFNLGPSKRWSSLRVAYHSACSLQHGQHVHDAPKTLLSNAGYSVVEIPEGHICCGSAGTYNILQPEFAGELLDRKVRNIKSVKPDFIATGNIGCMTQIARGTEVPVVHTIELLDWAHGGPVPRGLEPYARFVTDVPQPRHTVEDFMNA